MITTRNLLLLLGISCVQSYPNYWSAPKLNPVHGLYIKPSNDGTTGDLFVAATEDHGVKSQWMVDQPVNFLQVPTVQPHASTLPLSYPVCSTSPEESSTQKRAIIPAQVASPPIQYAYAIPVASTEGTPVISYPYTYPVQTTPTETTTTKTCETQSSIAQYPAQFPFQLFYPQMMSAYTNAMTILKDAGLSDDKASSVMAQTSPMWSPASYSYPMYVMVDPSSWTQAETTVTPPTSTSAPPVQDEANTKP